MGTEPLAQEAAWAAPRVHNEFRGSEHLMNQALSFAPQPVKRCPSPARGCSRRQSPCRSGKEACVTTCKFLPLLFPHLCRAPDLPSHLHTVQLLTLPRPEQVMWSGAQQGLALTTLSHQVTRWETEAERLNNLPKSVHPGAEAQEALSPVPGRGPLRPSPPQPQQPGPPRPPLTAGPHVHELPGVFLSPLPQSPEQTDSRELESLFSGCGPGEPGCGRLCLAHPRDLSC